MPVPIPIVIAMFLLLAVCSTASAQEMRCNKMPFVVNLPEFQIECGKHRGSPDEQEKARAEAAKGKGWILDLLEATSPQNAETYGATFARDAEGVSGEEMGTVILSIADQNHGLAPVDARKAVEGMVRAADQMFSDTTRIKWFSPSTLSDYDVREYSTDTKSSAHATAPRSCFAFARRTGQSTDGKRRDRLWGFYCRVGAERVDQVTMKRVLSAISTR